MHIKESLHHLLDTVFTLRIQTDNPGHKNIDQDQMR